jgi:hypothetical protein
VDNLARGQVFFSSTSGFFFHYHSTNASYSFSPTFTLFGNQGTYGKVLSRLVSSLKDVVGQIVVLTHCHFTTWKAVVTVTFVRTSNNLARKEGIGSGSVGE